MKKILNLVSLTIIISLAFSCNIPQKLDALKPQESLFNIFNPELADYTEPVGILATRDITNLNVDYTGFGFDNSITNVSNVSINSYFFHNDTTKITNFTNNFIYDDENKAMDFWFTANTNLDSVRQISTSVKILPDSNFFRFNVPLDSDEETQSKLLKINRMSVTVKYFPVALIKENYTTFYFKANNRGYGSLTLVGYSVVKGDKKDHYGDCDYTTPIKI